MVVYPEIVPHASRIRIDDEIRQVDTQIQGLKYRVLVTGGYDSRSAEDVQVWDAAAVAGFHRVVDVVIDELSRFAVQDRWSGDILERTVNDLVSQRMMWVYIHQHSKTLGPGEFTARMKTAIAARPSWQRLRRTVSELAAGIDTTDRPIISRQDERVPYSRTEAAERLGVSYDTLSRMMKDHKVKPVLVNKRWKIPQEEVDRLLATDEFKYRDTPRKRR